MRIRPRFRPSLQIVSVPASPSILASRIIYRSFQSSAATALDTERPAPISSLPPSPFPFVPRSAKRSASGSTSSSAAASTADAPAPTVPVTLPVRRRITSANQLPISFGRNQIIPVTDDIRKDLEAIVATFKAPIRYAFAYGSGVFRQTGYAASDKPLLDFVFAVSHPSHWHAINMQQNPTHYSLPMRIMGSDAVAWMQQKGLGAEVWFNVEVEVNGKIIKYGCISIDSLCRDLLEWQTLYISGRTQKPVRILIDDARVRLANQVNLASAFRTSLLLLPEDFTELQLYETIASLSYMGDFRMQVGENPLKVRNIVSAQLDSFRVLYGGLIKSFFRSVCMEGENDTIGGVRWVKQDISKERRALTASNLPVGLKTKILARYEIKSNISKAMGVAVEKEKKQYDVENQLTIWEDIVDDVDFKTMLIQSLSQIVAKPTFNQSLKGILSAGPVKSLRYIIPKLKKKWATQPIPHSVHDDISPKQ